MTEALPIAFVTFKRCVHETLAGTLLAFRVERSGPDWQIVFVSPSGDLMGIPPMKGMMTSEAAARGFAEAALEMALEEFDIAEIDGLEVVGELPPGDWKFVTFGGKMYGFCSEHPPIFIEDGQIRSLDPPKRQYDA